MSIIGVILTLVYTIVTIAFGIFLVKCWLDSGAPIASITHDSEKWEQEKRIIEGLDRTEKCRLQWEATWHNLSGTLINQDAHNQYLQNRACHSQLMEKYGKIYYLRPRP